MTERPRFDEAKRALTVAHERNTSLCDPFLDLFPIAGASLSLLAGPVGQSTICASSSIAVRLDELQFDLGEGPCWQALRSRRPVLAPNLREGVYSDWPVFASAVTHDQDAAEVTSMFAFPMVVGSLDIGAVDLYSTSPQTMTRSDVSDASALASVAAWQVLRRVLEEQQFDADVDNAASRTSRREVHQATGMVLAQLNVSADDAALLLRAHAFSSGRSVRDVATDVVERRLDFSKDFGSQPPERW